MKKVYLIGSRGVDTMDSYASSLVKSKRDEQIVPALLTGENGKIVTFKSPQEALTFIVLASGIDYETALKEYIFYEMDEDKADDGYSPSKDLFKVEVERNGTEYEI